MSELDQITSLMNTVSERWYKCSGCGTELSSTVETCSGCYCLNPYFDNREMETEYILKNFDIKQLKAYRRKSRATKLTLPELREISKGETANMNFLIERQPVLPKQVVDAFFRFQRNSLEWSKFKKDRFLRQYREALTPFELECFRAVPAMPAAFPRFVSPSVWRPSPDDIERLPSGYLDFCERLKAMDNTKWDPDWSLKQRHMLAHKYARFLTLPLLRKLLNAPSRPCERDVKRMVRRANTKR